MIMQNIINAYYYHIFLVFRFSPIMKDTEETKNLYQLFGNIQILAKTRILDSRMVNG